MKKLLISTFVLCACVFALTVNTTGQQRTQSKKDDHSSVAGTMLKGTGKVAVVVVGSAAKAAWVTTKFTAKYVAKPLLLKAAPKAGLFLLKKSAVTAKYIVPTVMKLALL